MYLPKFIPLACVATFIASSSLNASTLGSGEIYYSATAMRNTCHEIFPKHQKLTNSGYQQWAVEHKQELDKAQTTKNYNKYLLLTENMTRYALTSKKISMSKFEHKCSDMYEVLSKSYNN